MTYAWWAFKPGISSLLIVQQLLSFFHWDVFLQHIENSCSHPSSAFCLISSCCSCCFYCLFSFLGGELAPSNARRERVWEDYDRFKGPSMWCRDLEGITLHGKGQQGRPGACFAVSELQSFTAELPGLIPCLGQTFLCASLSFPLLLQPPCLAGSERSRLQVGSWLEMLKSF